MKKRLIPVAIAIVLIVVVLGIAALSRVLDKYSYSKERADLNSYFGVSGEEDTAIILNDELIETKAIYRDGQCYFSIDFVNEQLNDHFYYDMTEGLVLFTNDYDKVMTQVGSTDFTVSDSFTSESYVLSIPVDKTVYLSADFLRNFCNFAYEYFPDPNRVVLSTRWDVDTYAQIKKDTQIRVLGGIKSEILADVKKGAKVEILQEMDTWSEVKTLDGVIGYVENKRLENKEEVPAVPVNDVPVPEYVSIKHEGKICLVWNQVTNTTANGNAAGFLESTQGINVISPTWFSLSDEEGNFTSLADAAYVQDMHARGIQVWAAIDNFNNDPKLRTAEVVNVTSRRTKLINDLVNTVLSYGIDGINVDFEAVTSEAAEGYIQFLRELSIECRKHSIVLSVDNSNLVSYDRAKQGEVVDYVIIMGYDEHAVAADGPGPTASIEFVRKGIERTLDVVPAEKVINGIPFYSRVWTTTGDISNTAYTMGGIQNYLSENNIQAQWDDAVCQYTAQYEKDGIGHVLWMEDKESLTVKLSVMSQYPLAGVACWRLGQETPDVWEPINAYLQQ